MRAKLSPKKEKVDVAFLGEGISKRRKNQFDAARRKLEGVFLSVCALRRPLTSFVIGAGKGKAEEQRSDGETDDEDSSGVLEGAGEVSALVNFPR